MNRPLLRAGSITVMLFAASAAHAMPPTNPLHPAYFSAAAMAKEIASPQAESLARVTNPLHPQYVKNPYVQSFIGAAKSLSAPYRDRNNPLYPGYKRG